MMEVSLANADQTGSLLAPGGVLTVPIITAGDVSGSSGATTTTFINVPIVSRDGTFLNTGTQGFVIASGPDGTGTMFLDSSQVTVLAQGAQIAETFTPVENAELGESGEEPIIDGTVLSPSGKENRNASIVSAVDSEIKPPVGKGPFRCSLCDKLFLKWNQLQRHSRLHADDKPYRCHVCEMTFNVEANLTLHKAIHNVDNPTCPECGKRFSRVAGLKSHIIMHQKEEGLVCSECGEEFSTQMRLEKHMKCHEEEQVSSKVYQCKQCTQTFTHASSLKDHMKVHSKIKASLSHRTYNRNIDRSTFNHKCNTCDKSFQKPSQLERHRRIHTGERPYICDQCGKSFNQKGALQIHMTKHSGERPYRCDLCPSAFSQRGNLRAHIVRVHMLSKAGDQPVYCCEECTCVFRKLGSLNAHISRMHADDEELTAMAITDKDGQAANGKAVSDVIKQLIDLGGNIPSENEGIKEFEEGKEQASEDVLGTNSDILQQALQNSGLTGDQSGAENQTGNKVANKVRDTRDDRSSGGKESSNKIVPRLSNSAFVADSTNVILKKHLIRKVGGIRWHQCMYCSKEFKKPSDLVRHIRIHTHEKPYKCMQCFRSFTVKSTLTAHIRTHTGVKEFYCDICEKMFSTQGSLKVHSRLHTGAKPFECPHCDKRFRTSGHRKSHLVSHMKDGEAKRPRKPSRKAPPRNDSNLPVISLQEPILITDAGLVQTVPKYGTAAFNHLVGEEVAGHDRPYKCLYCARAFKKSSHLKQHIRSHTGEKPYKCNICMRSFVSSGVLKSHMRTHTGVKAYRCIICEASFTTNGSLKRHMSIHSELRPFMCPYCQKTFKTSVNCKKHMKTHKHELALQAAQANSSSLEGATTIVTENLQEIELNTEQIEVEEKMDVNEEHDVATTTIGTLSETLTQENLQQLQQSLSHHVFGEPAVLTEADLGDKQLQVQQTTTFDQSTFTQQPFEHFSSGTFTISCEALHHTLDITELGDNFGQGGTALVSTNIANILPTQDSEEPVAAADDSQPEEVDVGTQTVPTEITPDETTTPNKHLRSYACTYCSKSFKKSSHLKQHIRSHTGEKPFKCNVCNRFFVSMAVLKSHLKTHTGVKDFKCQICEATFTTNGSLTRHGLIHTAVKQIKCPFCKETFRTTLLCRRHVRTHREVTEEQPVDGTAAEGDAAQLRRTRTSIIQFSEEQTVSLAKQLVTECATISEKILIASAAEKDRVSEIKNREQELQSLPKHQHVCDQCPKSFKKPSDLIRHTRIHTGEKPYNCSICQKAFTVKSTLDSHLKTHTGEKLFNCHVCNSMFATKGSLKVHMRLHTGAKPFKCPHCELRFRTSGHRKSHISTHFKQGSPNKRYTVELDDDDDDVGCEMPSDSALLETDAAAQANICDVAEKDNLTNSILLNQGLLPPGLLNISHSAAVLPNITLSVDGLTADDGQVIQGGGESVQLHLGQGIHISGVDSNLIAQTIQIDANLLRQLQQQGNINITVNPNILTQGLTLDENMLPIAASAGATNQQNIIIHPMNILPLEDQSQVIASIDPANNGDEISGGGAIYHICVDEPRLQPIVSDEPDVVNNAETQVNLNITESGEIVTKIEPVEMDVDLETDDVNPSNVYVCQLCDKRFRKSDSYKKHLLTHEGGLEFYNNKLKSNSSASTNNHCAICGKSFTKPSQLERHMRIHTGERPFICNICNKAFNQKNALQIHMSRHTGKKPHKCSFCNLAFTQKGNLNVHIRRVHVNDRREQLNDNISILSDIPPLLTEMCSSSISDENGNNDHADIAEEDEPDISPEPRHNKWYCDTPPLLN